jgi:uncharacterized protein (DUF433 family)
MDNHLITIDPEVRSGQPCVSGTRLTVYDVAETLAYYYSQAPEEFAEVLKAAWATAQTIDDFPQLTEFTIAAALRYAKQHPRP